MFGNPCAGGGSYDCRCGGDVEGAAGVAAGATRIYHIFGALLTAEKTGSAWRRRTDAKPESSLCRDGTVVQGLKQSNYFGGLNCPAEALPSGIRLPFG